MLIQEFVDRTGYIPTDKEWDVINAAYMDCDVDKDAFCKHWCACNRSKVGTYFRACREQERLSDVFERVVKFIYRCKKTRDDFYGMSYIEQQDFMDDMQQKTKCKDREELKEMLERLHNATAIRNGWGARTHSLLFQLELMA